MKNTIISERLIQLIEYLGVNPNDFAKKLGYTRSQAVYDMIGGKSKPSFDFFDKLLNSEYSEKANLEWIISGRGDMVKENIDGPAQVYKLKTDRLYSGQQIPLYNIEASAGIVTLFKDSNQIKPIDHIQIPNLPKCDGAVYISGDSMYPLLKSGDIVMYRQHDISDGIIWGEMYLISYDQSGDDITTVKYIKKSDIGADHIKLVSQNQHHQDRDIPLNKVRALALVKASIRINSMS
jgi:phage repressor protein C with HTH and peptisase S24 domain